MNWDYVRGKKKTKGKKKKTNKKETNKKKKLKKITVEHGSLLNCSGGCDGINCCKSVIITK
jgi:hypothetical protein